MSLWVLLLLTVACETKDPFEGDSGDGYWASDDDWSTADGSDDWGSGGGSTPTQDSCSFSGGIMCVEANEPDNQAWCGGLPAVLAAVYSTSGCPDGATNTCTNMGAGGEYTTSGAKAYFYGVDGEETCAGAGGTYR